MAGDSRDVARKVRVPRVLYARLQQAAELYQVEGGVSGIVRRTMRAAESGRVARASNAARATRDGSTVLTVFLPGYLAERLDGMSGGELGGVIAAYLDLPRPAPPRLCVPEIEAGVGYVVAALEG